MIKPLLIVDTNVFINALFEPQNYQSDALIFQYEYEGKVEFAFSHHTMNELLKLMCRIIEENDIFECKYIFDILYDVFNRSLIVDDVPKLPQISSDDGDQPFIELAIDLQATYLVTNDFSNGLIDKGTINEVEILTPEDFIVVYEHTHKHTINQMRELGYLE